jgi:fermentation-respiration switch protein FrsA (DUF1100 family)
LISWFKYDPAKELAKLKIPVLIIQGTTNIQVRKEDTKILSEANPKADIKIIKGMNHIFKEDGLDRMKNIETYNQPELQIKQELVEVITDFIKKKKASITRQINSDANSDKMRKMVSFEVQPQSC